MSHLFTCVPRVSPYSLTLAAGPLGVQNTFFVFCSAATRISGILAVRKEAKTESSKTRHSVSGKRIYLPPHPPPRGVGNAGGGGGGSSCGSSDMVMDVYVSCF